MLRRIAGEGGINSMRVNLVHKGKKSSFEEQISFSFFTHNLKAQVFSLPVNPSFHPVGGEWTRSLYSSENVNLTKKSLCCSDIEHWKHWNSKPEDSAWTVFLNSKMQQTFQDFMFSAFLQENSPTYAVIFPKKSFREVYPRSTALHRGRSQEGGLCSVLQTSFLLSSHHTKC